MGRNMNMSFVAVLLSATIFISAGSALKTCKISKTRSPPLEEVIVGGVKRIQAVSRKNIDHQILVLGSSLSDKAVVSKLMISNDLNNEQLSTSDDGSPLESQEEEVSLVNSYVVNSSVVIYKLPDFDQPSQEMTFAAEFLTSFVAEQLENKIKVLVTVPLEFVNGSKRSIEFDKIVTTTVKLFKGYRRNMFSSFGLVVTGEVGGVNGSNSLVESVGEYLQNYAGRLSDRRDAFRRVPGEDDDDTRRREEIDRKLDLLNSFTKQKTYRGAFSRIAVIQVADLCGPMKNNYSYLEIQGQLEMLLDNLENTRVTRDTFQFKLENLTISKIRNDFVSHALAKIEEIIKPLEINLTKTLISPERSSIQNPDLLKEIYGKLVDLFQYNKISPDGDKEVWVVTNAEKVEKAFELSDLEEKLSSKESLLPAYALEKAAQFLNKLDPPSNRKKWKVGENLLKTISHSISNSRGTNILCQNENQQSVISGRVVKFSDFIGSSNELPCGMSSLKELVVLASDTVYIDRDILAESQGLTIVVIADTWEIVGLHRQILLNGATGPSNVSSESNGASRIGEDGRNGVPGNPGGNGGLFLGIYGTLKNNVIHLSGNGTSKKGSKSVTTKLTISSKGGKGGRGQDGGSGLNGQPGRNATMDDFPSPLKFENGKIPEKFRGQYYKLGEFIVRRGRRGGNGGDGGKRGSGGNPGYPGIVEIINVRSNRKTNPFTVYLCKGAEGDTGNYGKSGDGGRGGFDFGCKLSGGQWTECKQLLRKNGPPGEEGSVDMYSENGARKLPPVPLPFAGYAFGKAVEQLKTLPPPENDKEREFVRIMEENPVIREKCVTVSSLQKKLSSILKSSYIEDASRLEELLKKDYPLLLNIIGTFAQESLRNGMGFEEKLSLNYLYSATLSSIIAFTRTPCMEGISVEEGLPQMTSISTMIKDLQNNDTVSLVDFVVQKRHSTENKIRDKIAKQRNLVDNLISRHYLNLEKTLVKMAVNAGNDLKAHDKNNRDTAKFENTLTLQMVLQFCKLVQYFLLASDPTLTFQQILTSSGIPDALDFREKQTVEGLPSPKLTLAQGFTQALKKDMPSRKTNYSFVSHQLDAAWNTNEGELGEELRHYFREFRSALWEMRDATAAVNLTRGENPTAKMLLAYLTAPDNLHSSRLQLVYQIVLEVIASPEANSSTLTVQNFIFDNNLSPLKNITKVLEMTEPTNLLHRQVEKYLLREATIISLITVFKKDTLQHHANLKQRQRHVYKLLTKSIDEGAMNQTSHLQTSLQASGILKNVKVQVTQMRHLFPEAVKVDIGITPLVEKFSGALEQLIDLSAALEKFQKLGELADFMESIHIADSLQPTSGTNSGEITDNLKFLTKAVSFFQMQYNDAVGLLSCMQMNSLPYEYGYILREEDSSFYQDIYKHLGNKDISKISTAFNLRVESLHSSMENMKETRASSERKAVVHFSLQNSQHRHPNATTYTVSNGHEWVTTMQQVFIGQSVGITMESKNGTTTPRINGTELEDLQMTKTPNQNNITLSYHLMLGSLGASCWSRIKEMSLKMENEEGKKIVYKFEKQGAPPGSMYSTPHSDQSHLVKVLLPKEKTRNFLINEWTIQVRGWDELLCGELLNEL